MLAPHECSVSYRHDSDAGETSKTRLRSDEIGDKFGPERFRSIYVTEIEIQLELLNIGWQVLGGNFGSLEELAGSAKKFGANAELLEKGEFSEGAKIACVDIAVFVPVAVDIQYFQGSLERTESLSEVTGVRIDGRRGHYRFSGCYV